MNCDSFFFDAQSTLSSNNDDPEFANTELFEESSSSVVGITSMRSCAYKDYTDSTNHWVVLVGDEVGRISTIEITNVNSFIL